MPTVPAGFPLSAAQLLMASEALSDASGARHLTQSAWRLTGAIDREQFQQAWSIVMARHEALRTSVYAGANGVLLQRVNDVSAFPLESRSISAPITSEVVHSAMLNERAVGLDLSAAPVGRLLLLLEAPDSALLIWTYSHVLIDGWSAGLVADEVAKAYEGLRAGVAADLDAPGTYRAYVDWLASADLTDAEVYWAEQLAGITGATPLSTEGMLKARSSGPGARATAVERSLELDVASSSRLRRITREFGVTLSGALHAVWACLLSCYADQTDVVFGMVTAGRPVDLDGVENTVGMFVNALPVRVTTRDTTPLGGWLHEHHRRLGGLLEYQHAPPSLLPTWIEIVRDAPLFRSVVNVQNQLARESESRGAALRWQHAATMESPLFPLELGMVDSDPIRLSVTADPLWFDEERCGLILLDVREALERLAEASTDSTLAVIIPLTSHVARAVQRARGLSGQDHPLERLGFRTSLEELESVAEAAPQVRRAAITVFEHLGRTQLGLFYEPAGEPREPEADVRSVLASSMPGFLVPVLCQAVGVLPASPSGELDRRLLPEPDVSLLSRPPETKLQADLALLWAEVLGVEHVGVDDNFFDMGGESLAAMRISARSREAIGIDVPMSLVLERQTVAAVAQSLDI